MIPSLNRDCVLDEALMQRLEMPREALTQHCVTFSRPWISQPAPLAIDHYHFKM